MIKTLFSFLQYMFRFIFKVIYSFILVSHWYFVFLKLMPTCAASSSKCYTLTKVLVYVVHTDAFHGLISRKDLFLEIKLD